MAIDRAHLLPALHNIATRLRIDSIRSTSEAASGHPTSCCSMADVLAALFCAAIGTALNARRIKSGYRTYVLLGDGESAEGSVWEAADVAALDNLDTLCGITDVNGLGQSRATMWDHDMAQFERRWKAFGWHAIVIDGHDMNAILDALGEAKRTKGQPTMILARTIKGKGVSFVEGKDGWHGKTFKKGEETDRAIAELEKQFVPVPGGNAALQIARPAARPRPPEPSPKPVA